MSDPVTATLIMGALQAGTSAVVGHQQNVAQKRVARESMAQKTQMEMDRRRRATAADRLAKDQEAQAQKVASARVQSKRNQLLGLKGIQQRGVSPAPTGFSGITSNVLQEGSNVG